MRTERNFAFCMFLAILFFINVFSNLSKSPSTNDEFGVARRLVIGKISRSLHLNTSSTDETLDEQQAKQDPRELVFTKISDWIAKTYDITHEKALETVRIAHRIGEDARIDPLLILAVISVESRFIPTASSGAGAIGLMQVVPKWHAERIRSMVAANQTLTDPETNIRLGGAILKEYLRIARGRTPFALQMYNGSADDDQRRYSTKVLARLRQLTKISDSKETKIPT